MHLRTVNVTARHASALTVLSVLGLCVAALIFAGCTSAPKGVKPVTEFDAERYLGKWYEIARLDHSFERGLTDVTATYTLAPDGAIAVLNRGYLPSKKEWDSVEGRGVLLGSPDIGSLKVKVGAPFYGGYHVIALAPDYSHAMVAGPTRDYLWILARSPKLAPTVLEPLVAQAKAQGFETDKLIYVAHGAPTARQ